MSVKNYRVRVNGIEHTMQLSDEDAKRYPGAVQVGAKSDSKVETKQRHPRNKSA